MEVKSTMVGIILVILAVFSATRAGMRFKRPPYKLMKNAPHVTLYENENFRGNIFNLEIGRGCVNVPEEFAKWASSFESHRRCVDICPSKNCAGACARIDPNSGYVPRLRKIGLNDAISSVKSCYV